MPGRHVESIAIIHLRITWGARKVHLSARFSGAVFLGIAVLVVLDIIALDGRRWLGH